MWWEFGTSANNLRSWVLLFRNSRGRLYFGCTKTEQTSFLSRTLSRWLDARPSYWTLRLQKYSGICITFSFVFLEQAFTWLSHALVAWVLKTASKTTRNFEAVDKEKLFGSAMWRWQDRRGVPLAGCQRVPARSPRRVFFPEARKKKASQFVGSWWWERLLKRRNQSFTPEKPFGNSRQRARYASYMKTTTRLLKNSKFEGEANLAGCSTEHIKKCRVYVRSKETFVLD